MISKIYLCSDVENHGYDDCGPSQLYNDENHDPEPPVESYDNPGPSQIDLTYDSEELPAVPFLNGAGLYELFPNLSKAAVDMIYKLSSRNYTVAVNCLLDLSGERILSLMESFSMTGPPIKLRIEEEDILEDALAFYKAVSFDSTRPLRLSLAEQPAIDTGGIRQQFFNDLFECFAFKDPFSMFSGERCHLRPHHSPELLPLFKLLGIMIAHSLTQGGPGFPYFAPCVYWYLVTNSEELALSYVSSNDLCVPVKEITDQVSKS